MYTTQAYRTDHYNQRETEFKEFHDLQKMWNYCKEFLSLGNRCVVVHRTDKRWKWGMNRDRPHKSVKKIGVFRTVEELPQC